MEERRLPRYLQLYREIREDITEGRYRLGERLPSKRLLAEEHGISVITVEHCCRLLEEEGYIEARERSGFFVSYRESDSFPVRESGGEDEKRRGREGEERESGEKGMQTSGEGEGMPYPILARTVRRTLSEYGERILRKSPGGGIPELREAIAAYLRRSRGIRVSREQILLGSGAEYLYLLIVQMLGREKLYGIEDPSYRMIERVYTDSGARIERLRLGREGILSEELRRSRAEVLHVTPFHSYPSGVIASASKRHEYIRFAREKGVTVIEDDFDSEFSGSTKTEDTLFSLEPESLVIYVNSFSKTIAPSIRVGYLLLPRERAGELSKRISAYSCTVPVLDQYFLTELLKSGDFERHINRVRRRRRAEGRNS